MTLSRVSLLIPALTLIAAAAFADSDLADVIRDGRQVAAFELIDEGYDVNATQPDGTTPLHWAAYRLDLPLVQRLLEAGAKADVSNDYGATPLAEAVKAVDEPLVRTLLEAGADPDSPNLDGQTVLMLAAENRALGIGRLLVEAGANVNARELWRNQSALMWAIDNGDVEFTRFLIEHGADVTVRADANDWGSQITSEPRAQYRPTGGLTPLLFAARSGCTDCAAAVLDAGARIDRPTPDGVTPLMLAIDNNNFETAALLLDRGANPHYSDWWGRTALYIAVDVNSNIGVGSGRGRAGGGRGVTSLDLIERLLAAGVNVNPQLNFHRPGRGGSANSARFGDDLLTTGATPLLRAAIQHDHAAMRLLLEHGALVDLPNVMGVTPLMAAASLGVRDYAAVTNRSPDFVNDPTIEDQVIESLTILLEAGADINARVTDNTSRTARIGRPSQMNTDRQGVNNREGQTALFRVAGRGWEREGPDGQPEFEGWVRVLTFMLEHGADPAIQDALGRRAIDAALGTFDDGDPVYEDLAELLD